MKTTQTNQDFESSCFLPDFCNIRITLAVVLAAELLAVALSVAAFSSVSSFWLDLGMLSLFVQWIALSTTASLCLLKPVMRKMTAGLSGSLAMLLILGVTLIVAQLSYSLILKDDIQISYAVFMTQSLIVSSIIGLLSLHYFYIQNQLSNQQRAEADARFQALQARIRPHFLFNSMNTIAHLTRADPELAETVVLDLAELFRAAMGGSDKLSTLGEEINLAQGYMNIESTRLGKRLSVNWDIDKRLNGVEIPALILQPLFENAVYHGIEPAAEGGLVEFKTRRQEDKAVITISNTLDEMATRPHRQGNQIAQDNIEERILGFFQGKASFATDASRNSYIVTMVVPLKRDESK